MSGEFQERIKRIAKEKYCNNLNIFQNYRYLSFNENRSVFINKILNHFLFIAENTRGPNSSLFPAQASLTGLGKFSLISGHLVH